MLKAAIACVVMLGAWQGQPAAKVNPEASAAFEQFKKLAGEWEGQNNEGVKIKHRFSVIAAGSVVMQESWFDAHDEETMVTMYHLDRGELMLTHYCVAKNQPRLKATKIEDGGKKVTFTFLDGTNLKSRNQGHMDKAIFDLSSAGTMKSRWTWYQDGKESWMESFVCTRRK